MRQAHRFVQLRRAVVAQDAPRTKGARATAWGTKNPLETIQKTYTKTMELGKSW